MVAAVLREADVASGYAWHEEEEHAVDDACRDEAQVVGERCEDGRDDDDGDPHLLREVTAGEELWMSAGAT
jgi:hypothetical protein